MDLHQLRLFNYGALAGFIVIALLMQKTDGVLDTILTFVLVVGVLAIGVVNWIWAKCPHCGARQKELGKRCWRCKRPLFDYDVEV